MTCFSNGIKVSTEHAGNMSQATAGGSGFVLASDVCECCEVRKRLVDQLPIENIKFIPPAA